LARELLLTACPIDAFSSHRGNNQPGPAFILSHDPIFAGASEKLSVHSIQWRFEFFVDCLLKRILNAKETQQANDTGDCKANQRVLVIVLCRHFAPPRNLLTSANDFTTHEMAADSAGKGCGYRVRQGAQQTAIASRSSRGAEWLFVAGKALFTPVGNLAS
jgi:hypothetical protein